MLKSLISKLKKGKKVTAEEPKTQERSADDIRVTDILSRQTSRQERSADDILVAGILSRRMPRQDESQWRKQWKKEWRKQQLFKQNNILPRMRKATIEDYKNWLRGYILTGKIPSHDYDYSFYNEKKILCCNSRL